MYSHPHSEHWRPQSPRYGWICQIYGHELIIIRVTPEAASTFLTTLTAQVPKANHWPYPEAEVNIFGATRFWNRSTPRELIMLDHIIFHKL
jgi:hypothetical protein